MFCCNGKRTAVIVHFVCMFIVFGLTVAARAATQGPWLPDNSVSDAVGRSDGEFVTCAFAEVSKAVAEASPNYYVIQDGFKGGDARIVVISHLPNQLRCGYAVKVRGVLDTLPNGERCLRESSTLGYVVDSRFVRWSPMLPFLHYSEQALTAPRSKVSTLTEDTPPDDMNTDTVQPVFYASIDAFLADPAPEVGLPVSFVCKRIAEIGSGYIMVADDSSSAVPIKVYTGRAASTADRVELLCGQYRVENDTRVICAEMGPDGLFDPQGYIGHVSVAPANSVAYAKTLSDQAAISLTTKSVSAVQEGSLYIQDCGDFAGIRVGSATSASLSIGATVDIAGTMHTGADGERELLAYDGGVTAIEAQSSVVKPYLMTNRSLLAGTGAYGGLDTTGQLVRTCGRVTAVDAGGTYFYIDDGTGAFDGSGYTGVRVTWPFPTIVPPGVNSYVGVTGNSGKQTLSTGVIRVLQPRGLSSPQDVNVLSPTDVTDPAVSITTPAGAEIHMDSGATSAIISGEASDAGSGIASVQVKIGSGTFQPAVYTSSSETWTYTWQSPASTTITVRATNFAGRHTDAQRTVTVSSVSIIYVDGSSPNAVDDASHGTSWSTPYKTVVYAVNSLSGTKDVWVAKGTYVGCITMKPNVGLYGGFSGQTRLETYREQRDWAINTTILDGNEGESVVKISGSGMIDCAVDGFTIQHGAADYGGGVYSSGSAVIANNLIRGNRATTGGGGGICASGNTTVVGNVVMGNSASMWGGGIMCSSNVPVVNNTIIGNTAGSGGGVYASCYCAALCNNIIAFNTGGGVCKVGSTPNCQQNDVYGNSGYQYNWIVAPATHPSGDLEPVDPGIPYTALGDWHISWTSPCRDAGEPAAVSTTLDIDGENRRNGPIDIGADETDECWRWFTLKSASQSVQQGASASVVASVSGPVPGVSAAGCKVWYSVDVGEILSVTREGTTIALPSGTRSTYGVTDGNGKIEAKVTRPDEGYVCVTGTVKTCERSVSKTASVWFYNTELCRVGFFYDLCYTDTYYYNNPAGCIDDYLTRIATRYPSVRYSRITGSPSITDVSFNTVFLALPTRDLTASELAAIASFVASGPRKRIVLIGEYSGVWHAFNDRLNKVAIYLGVNAQFCTGSCMYDNPPPSLCAINQDHYLMTGVVNPGIMDAATDTFDAGWGAHARPLAYIAQQGFTALPWILEEDMPGAGSRVLIHDSNIMDRNHTDSWDTAPNKNFMFIHNLCTIFPE